MTEFTEDDRLLLFEIKEMLIYHDLHNIEALGIAKMKYEKYKTNMKKLEE